jgi:tRNA (adenine58-N1)-methyltransferase non-catalytic subunit
VIEEDVNIRDNRDVFDDKTAQLLTAEEIKQFRSGMSSKEIISTIVSNNTNFEKKSAFSQEKYLRSKEKRFLRAFTPIQPTVGNVCEFLWSDRRERCMYDPV